MLGISTNSNMLHYQSDLCVHVKLIQTDINNEHTASHAGDHKSVKHISIDSVDGFIYTLFTWQFR